MKQMTRWSGALALLLAVSILGGCGTAQRFNDAVRIKPEQAGNYGAVPNTTLMRDGRTLRGTVKQVVIAPSKTEPGAIDTFYVFLDARAEDKPANYEMIPLHDIERVGSLMNLPPDTLTNNINVVESFSNTEMIPQLRRVPMAVYRAGPPKPQQNGGGGGGNPCNCEPLDLGFSLPSLECPEREYDWFFVEGRGVYASFLDLRRDGTTAPRQTGSADVALGFRLGAGNEWGVGLLTSIGNTVNNVGADSSTPEPRTSVMGYVRYQTPGPVTSILGICMKPFFYGSLGVAIDHASLSLLKFNLTTGCTDCQSVLDAAIDANPSVDLDMPISYGFGLGAEFPVATWLDIGIDIGYRRLSIADEIVAGPVANLPSRRNIDMFLLRFGVTY